MRTLALFGCVVVLGAGCQCGPQVGIDAGTQSDAGSTADAGPKVDAGPTPDGSVGGDAGSEADAGGHRPKSEECPLTRAPGSASGSGPGGCTSDLDCVDGGINGRCSLGEGVISNRCTYDQCFRDADCAQGPCACRSPEYSNANVCLTSSTCRVDSDCRGGRWCSLSPRATGATCALSAYHCRTSTDLCTTDADCADAGSRGVCAFDASNRWSCSEVCLIL